MFWPDDILFMDESSVHVNMGMRKYGSSRKLNPQKGHRAVHFSKHPTGCSYTLHLIAGLHGKIFYEITSGPSNSMTFIKFMHNASNAILDDDGQVMQNGHHVILDSASVYRTFAEDVVAPYLDNLGITYTFLPRYSCDMNPVESVFMKLNRHFEKDPHHIVTYCCMMFQ